MHLLAINGYPLEVSEDLATEFYLPPKTELRSLEFEVATRDATPRPTQHPVIYPAMPIGGLASIGDPQAVALNPHVEEAEQHTIDWAYRFMLIVDEETSQLLRRVKFTHLAAGGYPTAGLEALKLACDWCTWLFFYDDWYCDDAASEFARDPLKLAAVHRRLLEILSGQARPQSDDSPLAHTLSDLRRRFLQRAGNTWMGFFLRAVRAYFQANLWEVETRASGRIPPIGVYTKMRPYAGAVHTVFDLLDIALGQRLPVDLREHVMLQQLVLMANNCICWVNDIFSVTKEIQEGNRNNLVLLLSHEQGLTLPQAVEAAVDLHNRELLGFLELERRMPGFAPGFEEPLSAFLRGVRAWIFGNLAWSRTTARYQECVNMKNWVSSKNPV